MTYMEEHNVLSPFQFGFRKQHCTYMPVALIVDEITKSLEKKKKIVGLYLDLKKAFDTVDISILLTKIKFLGIQGNLFKIIQSYFQNRVQCVRANGHTSTQSSISMGVPQGSILGPSLFIIYINDIINAVDEVNFFLYADDTAALIQEDSIEALQNKINRVLPKISEWFVTNRLSLNSSKSFYQVYSNSASAQEFDIHLHGSKISRHRSIRYLGTLIDENLKWKTHINAVCQKISCNIGVMSRAKYYISSKELLLLYNTLVLPHINYCAFIWGSNYSTRVYKIVRLQKRARRIIDKKPTYTRLMNYLLNTKL